MGQTVWTHRELLNSGKTRAEIAGGVRAGKIHRLFHGVYTTTSEPTAETAWEALQKLRPDAVLEGKSAVEAYQGKQLSLPLHARVPTSNLRKGAASIIRLRKSRRIRYREVRNFRVVSLADAVATCLADGSVREGELRQLVERSYVSVKGVQRQEKEVKELKTTRKAQLREFLRVCASGTDSGLEKGFVSALQSAGFQTQQNFLVSGYRWDTAIKALRVVIDVDSRKYHGSDERNFIVDRWKTNEAQAEGWLALRITDDCVNYAMPEIIMLLKNIQAFRAEHPRKVLGKRGMGPVWFWHNVLMETY